MNLEDIARYRDLQHRARSYGFDLRPSLCRDRLHLHNEHTLVYDGLSLEHIEGFLDCLDYCG